MVFVDTAGLREAGDEIEAEGIRRSHESLARAELVLLVLDAAEPFSSEDRARLDQLAGKRCILVVNKIDLPRKLQLDEQSWYSRRLRFPVSPGRSGSSQRCDQKRGLVRGVGGEMSQVMINSRHQEALQRARRHTQLCLEAFKKSETLELVAMDLRIATNAVGEIVGKTTTEDILDSIFSQFCIGK